MEIDCALLCDFVTVRENLLHILGGGLNELTRPTYPAPMGISLAVRILAHHREVQGEHTLQLDVISEDGSEVATIKLGFKVDKLTNTTDQANINLPFGLQGVVLPSKGKYSVEILINGQHKRSIPFNAKEAPQQ